LKTYYIVLLFLPCLFSCEFKQPIIPPESKKEEEKNAKKEILQPPPPLKKVTKKPVYYGRKATSVKKLGQDPNKPFQNTESSIILGTPRHPFPSEKLLE
jgi:hypothetical protein